MMLSLNEILSNDNLAEMLEDDQLGQIASTCILGYRSDENSRAHWESQLEELDQIIKDGETGGANENFDGIEYVKYPMIKKGIIDFAARAYSEIIRGDRVVKGKIIGKDPDYLKQKRVNRVTNFMSHQCLYENRTWESDVDKLLHMLAFYGTVFKKTYFKAGCTYPISELCDPKDVVVNYNATSLAEAPRVTHKVVLSRNAIASKVNSGDYAEIDLDDILDDDYMQSDHTVLLEQHCYLDLDEDGYAEPYIVTIHEKSQRVLAIYPRFSKESVRTFTKQKVSKVVHIEAEQYFIDFHLIPSADGGFYSVGLGSLLLPINKSVNTILNQLLRAGTLANLQGGLISGALRIKPNTMDMGMGRWNMVPSMAGADIARSIYPWPTKEPSPTLFNLLQLLIGIGRDLSSSTDMLDGTQAGTNMPATTAKTLVEQGMKVFNAIYKRLYLSLRKEFVRLYDLNRMYLSQQHYAAVLDDDMASVKDDFESKSMDILPIANPAVSSRSQQLARAQALGNIPGIDAYQKTRFTLLALGFEEEQIDQLLPKPDPNTPPPPDVQKLMAETQKLQVEAQAMQAELQAKPMEERLKQLEVQLKAKNSETAKQDANTRESEAQVRSQKMMADGQVNIMKQQLAQVKSAKQAAQADIELQLKNKKQDLDFAADIAKTKASLDKGSKDERSR